MFHYKICQLAAVNPPLPAVIVHFKGAVRVNGFIDVI